MRYYNLYFKLNNKNNKCNVSKQNTNYAFK